MSSNKAYGSTTVSVEKSRAGIDYILRKWGALGVQWEEDFEQHRSTLRFRWPHQGDELVARIVLKVVKPSRIDARGRVRPRGSIEKAMEAERRRIHRVAFYWLKTQHEAVEAGLFGPSEVMLPWLEDGNQNTVAETLLPHLHQLGSMDAARRLQLPPRTQ